MTGVRKVWHGAPHFISMLAQISKGKEFGFSFNIADRCPVGCDCYWRAMGRVPELSDEQVIEFFQARRAEGKVLATIVGGEPYVRRNLLPRVTPIMPSNWVVTSATTPLLHLPKTTHFISIDGQDAATHDAVRKMPGLYDRILKHVAAVRKSGSFPAFIHSVLNALNYLQIGAILRTWRDNRLADGVAFSTITRIHSGGDDRLLLTTDQRKWIVHELLRQKEVFGTFLSMTPDIIQRFHPDLTSHKTPESCGTAKYVASFDAAGVRMKQCIFSEKGDCTQCGCVITPLVETTAQRPPNISTLRLLGRLYTA